MLKDVLITNKEYYRLLDKRNKTVYSPWEHSVIQWVNEKTDNDNKNNITRTKAYLSYYEKNNEIKWSLLASMVSRNAGWNMTDLSLKPYKQLFSAEFLRLLFHSYERPNWLIFSDAYPQLLIYQLSKKVKRPLFHLLKSFGVSVFMEYMWSQFWDTKNEKLLSYSQIVNEQALIQQPVLKETFYKHRVFDSLLFHLQELLRLNAVLFPTMKGKLYGFSVYRFNRLNKRIYLGKSLFWLLYESEVAKDIINFALHVEPTGSRIDYIQFMGSSRLTECSHPLIDLFDTIVHHRSNKEEWFQGDVNPKWFNGPHLSLRELTTWYNRKRNLVKKIGQLKERLLDVT